jgi:molecular chaperone GrpE
MGKTNGKSEPTKSRLDLEHELPAADDMTEEVAPPEVVAGREQPAAEAELEKLKREREELIDRLARLQAEFENARKRAAREQQDFRDFAVADAVKSLLPILDSFDRALAQSTKNDDLRGGVELMQKQLHDALGKLGLQPIPALGLPFDPRVHEAVEVVETDEAADHHVLEELQRGYKMKERLLRPAMVRVARNSKF